MQFWFWGEMYLCYKKVDHTFILPGESIVNVKITNVEAEIKLYPKLFMNTFLLGYKIRTF